MRIFLILVLGFFAHISVALAQNTGGVFPPMVNEGHRSAQFRIAVDPDGNNNDFRYASRLHYQQAINDDFMWRVIGQANNRGDNDVKFDFVQAELFWELSNRADKTKTGLRFDARYRDDNRPSQLGVNFMNQFDLGDGIRARALALTSWQFGDNAKDGINLLTRWQLAKSLPKGATFGVELYNNYGNTNNIRGFENQSHTIGPFMALPLDGVSIFAGPLFGLTDASPDMEARLWLTRKFD